MKTQLCMFCILQYELILLFLMQIADILEGEH